MEEILKPLGSLLATDHSKAAVVYSYVNGSGSITSVGEERAVVYL